MATGIIEKVTNTSGAGYCKMPDGTLIQWGLQPVDSSGNFSVSFSQAFASINYTPVCSWFTINGNVAGEIGTVKTHSRTVSGFAGTIAGSMPSGFVNRLNASWIAIGRWK